MAFAGSVAVAGAAITVGSIAGCGSDGPSSPTDTGGVSPAYGAPADTSVIDSSSPDSTIDSTSDSASDGDGTTTDTGGGGNLYGAPPG